MKSNLLSFLAVNCFLFAGPAARAANPAGPFYPPPLGVTFSTSGTMGDGNIARPGGKTYSFSSANLGAYDPMYWGAKPNAVKLSFYDSGFIYGGEVMTYNPGQSAPASGLLVWTGNTYMNTPSGAVEIVTRCRLVADVPLSDPAALGIDSSVGGVVSIPSPGYSWQATMYMEVEDLYGFVSYYGAWVPAYSFYDASHWDIYNAGAYSSFDAGFWYSNQPPTITAMTNVLMAPGSTTGPIPFTIGDIETPAAGLVVGKSSDNAAVLPTNQVVLSGSSPNLAVTLHSTTTPGVANVTISVQDSDGAVTNRIFSVTNDTPPIVSALTNQLIQMNTALGPIPFTIGDAETAASSLVVTGLTSNATLVAPTNVLTGGSDTNRTLTVIPTTNQFGTAVISVQVSDGLLTTISNFTLTVNSPPHLDANNQLLVNQGATVAVTTSELNATDPESSAAGLIFTINPDGGGGPPFYGTLKKSGVPLGSGDSFTLADVQNSLVTYTHDGSCAANDNFQMGLTDDMGGVWSDDGHTTFTFHVGITPNTIAPVAFNSALDLPLGSTYHGSLVASNADCRNTTLTYSITAGPTNGSISSFDPATGQYAYQAPVSGGADQFTFQVSNGALSSASPGVVNITIENQAPTANPASFSVFEGSSFNGILAASDPDLPPQTLTFSIVAQAAKGTAVITNTITGGFIYTPAAGQTGPDTFTFKVNDGIVDSAPAAVSVTINAPNPPIAQNGSNSTTQGVAVAGLLIATDTNQPPFALTYSIVTNGARGSVIITNSSSGGYLYTPQPDRFGTDVFAFKASNGVTDSAPAFVTIGIQPGGALFGDILIADSDAHALRLLNPTNGDSGILSSGGFITSPTFLASEPNGNVLMVDQTGGLIRINPANGSQTDLVAGSQFTFPVGVALEPAGTILVTDPFAGAIDRFSPAGTLLTNIPPGSLMVPAGVAVSRQGQIFIVDAAFFGGNPDGNKVVQIDPVSFSQTILSSTGLLSAPVGIVIEPDGNLLIAESSANSITRITLPGGTQSNLSTNGLLNGCYGLAIDQAGNLYAANQDGRSVIQVDRVSGAQTSIPSGNVVGQPFGITIAGQPVAAPRIGSLSVSPAGPASIHFAGYPGAIYSIYEAPDLSVPLGSWNRLGAASEVAPGQFQFTDSAASGSASRFYIVRYP
jgi:sugar lactone lactonase YvrE